MSRKKRRRVLLKYMKMKVADKDWHGVADAAMDMRELEAERRKR